MSAYRQFGCERHFTFVSLTNKGMSESLAILALTAVISFAGSIHPGPVNLSVVQATLNRNFKTGIWVAVSGTLPEIIYTLAALKSHVFLTHHPAVFDKFEIAIIPFFLIVGVYSLLKISPKKQEAPPSNHAKVVVQGFVGGLFNPQLFPFWVIVLVYLHSYFAFDSFSAQLSFVVGAALGAFLILLLFAYLAHRFQNQLHHYIQQFSPHKLAGLFFISMSVYQTFKILV